MPVSPPPRQRLQWLCMENSFSFHFWPCRIFSDCTTPGTVAQIPEDLSKERRLASQSGTNVGSMGFLSRETKTMAQNSICTSSQMCGSQEANSTSRSVQTRTMKLHSFYICEVYNGTLHTDWKGLGAARWVPFLYYARQALDFSREHWPA